MTKRVLLNLFTVDHSLCKWLSLVGYAHSTSHDITWLRATAPLPFSLQARAPTWPASQCDAASSRPWRNQRAEYRSARAIWCNASFDPGCLKAHRRVDRSKSVAGRHLGEPKLSKDGNSWWNHQVHNFEFMYSITILYKRGKPVIFAQHLHLTYM